LYKTANYLSLGFESKDKLVNFSVKGVDDFVANNVSLVSNYYDPDMNLYFFSASHKFKRIFTYFSDQRKSEMKAMNEKKKN